MRTVSSTRFQTQENAGDSADETAPLRVVFRRHRFAAGDRRVGLRQEGAAAGPATTPAAAATTPSAGTRAAAASVDRRRALRAQDARSAERGDAARRRVLRLR